MQIMRVRVPIIATLVFVNNRPQVHIEEGEPVYECRLGDEHGFAVVADELDEYRMHPANETDLTFEVKSVVVPASEETQDIMF